MNKEQKPMDPSRYPSYTEEDSAASGRRLNEILKVLKKHHLTSGLTPVKLREILALLFLLLSADIKSRPHIHTMWRKQKNL